MFKIAKWFTTRLRPEVPRGGKEMADRLLSETDDFHPEGISSKFLDVGPRIANGRSIAAISFHGTYPPGSQGREHASYIAGQSCFLMAYRRAVAIVIDLSDLSYVWGSDILGAVQTIDQFLEPRWSNMPNSKPIHIVASEKSIGLKTLFKPTALYDSVEKALIACDLEVERWFEHD